MGILDSIKKTFIVSDEPVKEASTVDITGFNELADFLGINGVSHEALSEATYYACIKVLSEGVGKLPLKLLKYSDKDGVISAKDKVLGRTLAKRPNPHMNSSIFWSTMEANRTHYGNAYALITGYGDNQQLWILPSNQVTVTYDDKKVLSNVADIYYTYQTAGKSFTFASDEIIHIKTSNTFDGIMGIPVREQLRSTIDGNAKAQKVVNDMYDSGFTAKAVLNYTGSLNDESVDKLKKGIEDYAKGGKDGKGQIIPIPLGFELTPLNVKLTDSQFIEVKQYSALQIASAFGIKPYQIGDYTKSSYNSVEAQQLSFYIDTLLYVLKQYEEELTFKLLSNQEVSDGYHFKFNVNAILRADFKTQIETLSKGVNSFLLTPNEARDYIDKHKIDGGDTLIGNGAAIPIELVGTQYGTNAADAESDETESDDGDENGDGKEESDE